jgi:hypothetical protein
MIISKIIIEIGLKIIINTGAIPGYINNSVMLWTKKFGLNIFQKEKIKAMPNEINAEYKKTCLRTELKKIAKAMVITKKKKILITHLHLYFIITKIKQIAIIKDKIIEKRPGFSYSSGCIP